MNLRLNFMGLSNNAKKIRDAYFKKDIQSMFENVTDEMVETFAVCGTEDECRKKDRRVQKLY